VAPIGMNTCVIKPENRAQIANDISVDMPFGTNQISTAENGQNHAQIVSVSRSVDICSLYSQNQAKLPKVACITLHLILNGRPFPWIAIIILIYPFWERSRENGRN